MAWETRARGGRYYYRSRRSGGRVVKEYYGPGRMGDLGEAMARIERTDRRDGADELRAERAKLGSIDVAEAEVDRTLALVVNLHLVCAGYHRHHRGEWRRRRGEG